MVPEGLAVMVRVDAVLKDRNGEPQRGGGSEWEPIKILFKNSAYEPDSTRAPEVHAATEVLLNLGARPNQ
jgi:hypothetical protein